MKLTKADLESMILQLVKIHNGTANLSDLHIME